MQTDNLGFKWLNDTTNEDVSRVPDFTSKLNTPSFKNHFLDDKSPVLPDLMFERLAQDEQIVKQANPHNEKILPKLSEEEEMRFFRNCVIGGLISVAIFKYIETKF